VRRWRVRRWRSSALRTCLSTSRLRNANSFDLDRTALRLALKMNGNGSAMARRFARGWVEACSVLRALCVLRTRARGNRSRRANAKGRHEAVGRVSRTGMRVFASLQLACGELDANFGVCVVRVPTALPVHVCMQTSPMCRKASLGVTPCKPRSR